MYGFDFFLPMKNQGPIRKIGSSFIKGECDESKKAFFKYNTEDNSEYILNRFIDAVRSHSLEDARAYISKNYLDRIDLNMLRTELSDINIKCSPFIVNVNFMKEPKNCRMNTVLFMDKERKKTRLFHIYMLTEPDTFGKWKIYGIEQE